jgi:hypothetical protein
MMASSSAKGNQSSVLDVLFSTMSVASIIAFRT